jgi:pimeloyl-ACP methyl ester carboxylesterase
VVQGLISESVEATQGVRTPCTVLWGSQDRSHRLTDPLAILRDAPHAEVVRLDDCGHFPDLESPQRFVQTLLSQMARYKHA